MSGGNNIKKLIYFNIPLVIVLIYLISIWVQPINSMIYLDDVNISELVQYRLENADDMGKLNEISSRLPGNISRSGEGLVWGSDANLQISYGYHGGNKFSLKKLDRYWRDNKEKIFLLNATMYFILIPKVQRVTIELDVPYKQKFQVTRKDLVKFYGRDLNEYYLDSSLFQREVIRGTIKSNKRLKEFFQIYKIEEVK